ELLQAPLEAPLPRDLWSKPKPWLRRRMHAITSKPGWWLNLPKLQIGWEMYAAAVDVGFDVEILTKGPSRNFCAWAEKAERISRDFGQAAVPNIVGKTKRRYYGRVLVDDYPPYVLDWLAHRPRGLAVLPAHDYNADFVHPGAIRYDGTNMSVVAEAMSLAFHRKPGEHWRNG